MKENNTIHGLFRLGVNKFKNHCAIKYKFKGEYKEVSYDELYNLVIQFSRGLYDLGLKKGDRIGILSYNRIEWVIADLASLNIGAIVVPIHHTYSKSQVEFVVEDSKIKVVIVSDNEQLSKLGNLKLKNIIIMDYKKQKNVIHFNKIYKKQDVPIPHIKENDIATICYTSGSTGKPKGVTLTHKNIISNILGQPFRVDKSDLFLSILPLSHMFEKTCGFYTPLFCGSTISYVESFSTFSQDFIKIKPTIVLVVPRILEKIKEAIMNEVSKSPIKKILFLKALEISRANLNSKAILSFRHFIIKSLIFKPIINKYFKNLRFFVSGGAHLDIDVLEFFFSIGIKILEGYGITEASPVVSVNSEEEFMLGSVGKPLRNSQVKLSKGGEILIKGPSVMAGYLNDKSLTKRTIKKGFLHTGDRGHCDSKGFLYIDGRFKNQIITSYGANVHPEPIEDKLRRSKFIEEAMIFGNNKKYIVALIVPKIKEFPSKSKRIINQVIQKEINDVNSDLASFEQIKKFSIVFEPFSEQEDLLTPTKKVNRKFVTLKYKRIWDALY